MDGDRLLMAGACAAAACVISYAFWGPPGKFINLFVREVLKICLAIEFSHDIMYYYVM
jgi:hypothetical protein